MDFLKSRNFCRWIEGEPTGDDSCFCGCEAQSGSPYCAEHHARAYSGLQDEEAARRLIGSLDEPYRPLPETIRRAISQRVRRLAEAESAPA